MWILWLIIVFGIPFYYAKQADNNKKSSLERLQNQLYRDQAGSASFTLTGRVPLFKEWSSFQPGYFRSSMFKTADEVRAYMKEHPCAQYTELEKCLETHEYSDTVKNAFLLWMFSSHSAVHGHQSLNCVDIRTAYNVFGRFYSGKYQEKEDPSLSVRIVLHNIGLWLVCFISSTNLYGLSEVVLVVALYAMPVPLIIMMYLNIKSIREAGMSAYDFIIKGMLGGTSADRLIGVYLGAQVARMAHQVTKKRW